MKLKNLKQGTKLSAISLVLLCLISVSGCSLLGAGQEGNDCSWVSPIFISPDDSMTDRTVEQILAHNETWKETCN